MTELKAPTLTGAETRILSKLMEAKEPVSKTDLMDGVTESDGSFKAIISKLRLKGFVLDPGRRGTAVPATYSLTDDEKAKLRKMGL